MRALGIGGHQSSRMAKDEWLTPPEIIATLGPFDLDPCAPIDRPWDTAKQHFTLADDGLLKAWSGFVWCNPPYGSEAGRWLRRLACHGNGIALVFARTETEAFFESVWERASSVLFVRGRLHFYHVDGRRASGNGGAPSVLIGYGEEADRRLEKSGLGHFVTLIAKAEGKAVPHDPDGKEGVR